MSSKLSFGHWELHTVVFRFDKSKGSMTIFIERKTRMYQVNGMPDRTALSMENAFGTITSSYPTGTFKTATTVRGREFACYASLEATDDIQVYFADPYSS